MKEASATSIQQGKSNLNNYKKKKKTIKFWARTISYSGEKEIGDIVLQLKDVIQQSNLWFNTSFLNTVFSHRFIAPEISRLIIVYSYHTTNQIATVHGGGETRPQLTETFKWR